LNHTLTEWRDIGIDHTNPEAYRLLRSAVATTRGPAFRSEAEDHYPLSNEDTLNALYAQVENREPERYALPPGVTERTIYFKQEAIDRHPDLVEQQQQQKEYLWALEYGSHLGKEEPGWGADQEFCNTHSASYYYPEGQYFTRERAESIFRSLLWLTWEFSDLAQMNNGWACQWMLSHAGQDLGYYATQYWLEYYPEDAVVKVGGVLFMRDRTAKTGIQMRMVERNR